MGIKMLLGIILHPFKRVYEMSYRKAENRILASRADGRSNYKKWQRMHDMSLVTDTGYTTSDLYAELSRSRGYFITC